MVLDFIEILKVIFLGIVEGITEWLPISSTGHMILVDEFITLNMSEAFKEMFFVVIQAAIATYIIMFTSSMIYSTLSLYMSDKVKIISGLSKCVCKASINIKSGVDNTPATLISTIFERFSFNNSQEIRLSNTATSNQFRKVVL